MDWMILVIGGILFDILIKISSRSHTRYLRGIDSIPAVSVLAGYLYGSATGFWAGLIVSVAYCIIRGRIGSAPLIIGSNAFIGFMAAFLAPFGLLYAGIVMLVVYHAISFIYSLVFSEPGPGYFMFTTFSCVFTIFILWIVSIIL